MMAQATSNKSDQVKELQDTIPKVIRSFITPKPHIVEDQGRIKTVGALECTLF